LVAAFKASRAFHVRAKPRCQRADVFFADYITAELYRRVGWAKYASRETLARWNPVAGR